MQITNLGRSVYAGRLMASFASGVAKSSGLVYESRTAADANRSGAGIVAVRRRVPLMCSRQTHRPTRADWSPDCSGRSIGGDAMVDLIELCRLTSRPAPVRTQALSRLKQG